MVKFVKYIIFIVSINVLFFAFKTTVCEFVYLQTDYGIINSHHTFNSTQTVNDFASIGIEDNEEETDMNHLFFIASSKNGSIKKQCSLTKLSKQYFQFAPSINASTTHLYSRILRV